ncbi:MAG: RluA family pseudouridine synthase [Lachnospiraceae bacterium]|nr:RluA family pseudouridine synthase [Lachnospiraceae bacterium]
MNILFEDQHIIVINKPSGVATQSASIGQKDIYSEALRYRKKKKEPSEIYLVHRLDQPVSGVMVLAKSKEAAAKLSEGVNSDFTKVYEALVVGSPKVNKETLEDYLIKDSKTNLSKVVDKSVKDSKKAILSYEVVDKYHNGQATLLKIILKTGRHHQIRVQLSHAGFPIAGDLKYASKESLEFTKENNVNRVLLCAVSNEFTHPFTGERLKFSIDNDFNL